MFPEQTRRLLDNILLVIDDFEQGGMDVSHLQSALGSCAATLDNSTKGVLDELRAVEADLETILFMVPAQEQPAAALVRLGELKRVINATS